MKADAFRKLALELPETVEQSHQGHPDFRVGGKIFASLGPEEDWAMLKLTPERQARAVAVEPKVFEPFNGAWGRRGYTNMLLAKANKKTVQMLLAEARRNTAPKRLTDSKHAE